MGRFSPPPETPSTSLWRSWRRIRTQAPTFCSRCTTSWSWNAPRRMPEESHCGSGRRWERPWRISWAQNLVDRSVQRSAMVLAGEIAWSWRSLKVRQKGESISDIARALQKAPGSIHGMIEATGGFSPPERHRRRCALTPAEREEISRGLATGDSLRAIAARLGRPASTVCREVNRNGGRNRYRAQKAEERASKHARRPKRCLLAIDDRLRDLVAERLKADWSPEQISGW